MNLIGMWTTGQMLEYAAGPEDAHDTDHEEIVHM